MNKIQRPILRTLKHDVDSIKNNNKFYAEYHQYDEEGNEEDDDEESEFSFSEFDEEEGMDDDSIVYEIEMGLPVEEFIYSEEYCGGMANGKRLKAVVAGGSSVPILPANLILKTTNGENRLMSYESLADGGFATGTMLGSGGFIAFDEDACEELLSRFYFEPANIDVE